MNYTGKLNFPGVGIRSRNNKKVHGFVTVPAAPVASTPGVTSGRLMAK